VQAYPTTDQGIFPGSTLASRRSISAGDVSVARLVEKKIAGAQPRRAPFARDRRRESLGSRHGILPVTCRDIGASHPDLADRVGRTPSPRLRIDASDLLPTVVARHLFEADKQELDDAARSQEDMLLAAIAEMPGKSHADLAKSLGWFMRNGAPYMVLVGRTAGALKRAKLVKDERGKLVLTEKGEKALEKACSGRNPILGVRRNRITMFRPLLRPQGNLTTIAETCVPGSCFGGAFRPSYRPERNIPFPSEREMFRSPHQAQIGRGSAVTTNSRRPFVVERRNTAPTLRGLGIISGDRNP